jgi:hypothetical protein
MWGRVAFVTVTAVVTACLIKPSPPQSGDDAGGDADGSTQNIIFVTSRQYQASDIANDATPAKKADALCAAAAMGHFTGTFIAWFSDSQSKAMDRLAGSRGWVRPDGKPFANDPVTGPFFYPPRLDENNTDVALSGSLVVATDTLASGANAICNTGAGEVMTGLLDAGATAWTEVACRANSVRLYCLGIGHVNDVAPQPVMSPTAWRSRGMMNGGNFNALDTICSDEATMSGVPGTFRALLSTPTKTATDHVRGTHTANVEWVRRDGVVVSRDAVGFDAPVELDVMGVRVAATEMTWGGALDPGSTASGSAANCGGWSSLAIAGMAGSPNRTHMPEGFGSATIGCTVPNYVYCFAEQ